jgi:hypothetical protein
VTSLKGGWVERQGKHETAVEGRNFGAFCCMVNQQFTWLAYQLLSV